jgi:hypothetical protein
VTFDQSADTFVRDLTFNILGNTLVAAEIFSGVAVAVTLTRQ